MTDNSIGISNPFAARREVPQPSFHDDSGDTVICVLLNRLVFCRLPVITSPRLSAVAARDDSRIGRGPKKSFLRSEQLLVKRPSRIKKSVSGLEKPINNSLRGPFDQAKFALLKGGEPACSLEGRPACSLRAG